MRRITTLLPFLISIILPTLFFAQIKPEYFDGPYIFHQNDSLRIQWVEAGVGHDSLIAKSAATTFNRHYLPVVNLKDLDFKTPKKVSFRAKKVVALSDVHGQYDILIKLLQNNGIINSKNRWNFDQGHLVIVGDNFDRGDKVLEILWFLFALQKDAHQAGGKVHVLLGNHEIMVLQGDMRYLNRKYLYTSGVLKTMYPYLFKKGSVLGDWIASHPVLTSINQNLFVHGGVSKAVLDLDLPLKKINDIFSKQLIRGKEEEILKDSLLTALYAGDGPLWYRGYFDAENFDAERMQNTLNRLQQNRVIVGHTSFDEITPMLDGKVIAVDCSIKKGITGQVLLMENGKYAIGDLEGNVQPIADLEYLNASSIFDYINHLDGEAKVKIETNYKRLTQKSSKEEYQPARFQLMNDSDKVLLDISGRIRARGNTRKKVCGIPPVKFDAPKSALDSMGFLDIDKLKFVFPCRKTKSAQELLYKEYFLYDLYRFIDSNSIQAKLVDIHFTYKGKDKMHMKGFVIEDEEEYTRRTDAKVLEKGKMRASRLDRNSFVKMIFFQYMIANTDWSLANRHNLELVKFPHIDKVIALPYDFDYSGFVGQNYAVPHGSLPIEDVHQRYFFSYKITEEEFDAVVKYYLSIESEVYRICEEATYMSKGSIKSNRNYLKDFFKLLQNPERLKSQVVKE